MRSPGRPEELPNAADVADVLGRNTWEDFSDALENMSDRVHGWTSGDMGIVGTSAYDPLFYVHQCNVDRIWGLWQEKHLPIDGANAIDQGLLDVTLDPFGMKVRDVLDVRKLGYMYER
jgi:tyrosinase